MFIPTIEVFELIRDYVSKTMPYKDQVEYAKKKLKQYKNKDYAMLNDQWKKDLKQAENLLSCIDDMMKSSGVDWEFEKLALLARVNECLYITH